METTIRCNPIRKISPNRCRDTTSPCQRRTAAGGAAIEALKLGYGGISYISQLMGCHAHTIRLGLQELSDDQGMNARRIRRPGSGRKKALEQIQGLDEAFLRVVAAHTAGSPMDESAVESVVSISADESVVVKLTGEMVVSISADEKVVFTSAVERVVSTSAVEVIMFISVPVTIVSITTVVAITRKFVHRDGIGNSCLGVVKQEVKAH